MILKETRAKNEPTDGTTNTQHSYSLRDGSRNYSLINKDSHINDHHFIVRLLYENAYRY